MSCRLTRRRGSNGAEPGNSSSTWSSVVPRADGRLGYRPLVVGGEVAPAPRESAPRGAGVRRAGGVARRQRGYRMGPSLRR